MRVLIACERSGVVRDAFIEQGHDAWSCDLVESEGHYRSNHLKCDIRDVIYKGFVLPLLPKESWDLMIAFPDCTYLCNSGVLRLYKDGKKINGPDEQRWEKMREAAAFFKELLQADIPRVALENPVMHGHAGLPKSTQSIQPYQFGEDASKRTCLWLKNLPKLEPTLYVSPQIIDGRKVWANQTPSGQNKLGPSPTRAMDRARTYQGIANAMAEQWGSL